LADGKLSALVEAGATLREGDKLDQVQTKDGSISLSDSGDVAIRVELNGGGAAVYLQHAGQLLRVAAASMDLAGVGTVDDAESEHVAVNTLGQVSCQVKLTDGRTALILATPVQ
jgi:hypothetical protein